MNSLNFFNFPYRSARLALGLGLSLALTTPARASGTTTPSPAQCMVDTFGSTDQHDGLEFYELWASSFKSPTRDLNAFQAQTGIQVTQLDSQGIAVEARIRVLSDNPGNHIQLVGDFNNWGTAIELHPVAGTPYYEGTLLNPKPNMQYRLVVNGEQRLDPSAEAIASPEYDQKLGRPGSPGLNSIYTGMDQLPAAASVDLRYKPQLISQAEVYELVRNWNDGHRTGPASMIDTYDFIAQSGIIQKLKSMGRNAVQFLPVNGSMDGQAWALRYQDFGLFGPDTRYGSPQAFRNMVDAFRKEGIAVVMDAVVGHYPFTGNRGIRDIGPVGMHRWTKADGSSLFGNRMSPWNTYRYDYQNPNVRRFLIDSILTMIKRYGISGIRFDNLDGIRFEPGGTEFLNQLMREVRAYRPETMLIGEMFFGDNNVMHKIEDGGMGLGARTDSDFFDWIKDNMLGMTEQVDMNRLRGTIRNPWDWKEVPRSKYPTDQDEANNGRGGATGQYIASLIKGTGADWSYVERKTKVFASLPLLTSSTTLDLPQTSLLQEGSFGSNPAPQWQNLQLDSQRKVHEYFNALSTYVRENPAFAFQNLHPNIENHTDYDNKVMSMLRIDRKTGKKIYAIINLSHRDLSNYNFGVDTDKPLRIAVDSSRREFGGDGHLSDATGGHSLPIQESGAQGKPRSVTLPVLPAYGVVVMETAP